MLIKDITSYRFFKDVFDFHSKKHKKHHGSDTYENDWYLKKVKIPCIYGEYVVPHTGFIVEPNIVTQDRWSNKINAKGHRYWDYDFDTLRVDVVYTDGSVDSNVEYALSAVDADLSIKYRVPVFGYLKVTRYGLGLHKTISHYELSYYTLGPVPIDTYIKFFESKNPSKAYINPSEDTSFKRELETIFKNNPYAITPHAYEYSYTDMMELWEIGEVEWPLRQASLAIDGIKVREPAVILPKLKFLDLEKYRNSNYKLNNSPLLGQYLPVRRPASNEIPYDPETIRPNEFFKQHLEFAFFKDKGEQLAYKTGLNESFHVFNKINQVITPLNTITKDFTVYFDTERDLEIVVRAVKKVNHENNTVTNMEEWIEQKFMHTDIPGNENAPFDLKFRIERYIDLINHKRLVKDAILGNQKDSRQYKVTIDAIDGDINSGIHTKYEENSYYKGSESKDNGWFNKDGVRIYIKNNTIHIELRDMTFTSKRLPKGYSYITGAVITNGRANVGLVPVDRLVKYDPFMKPSDKKQYTPQRMKYATDRTGTTIQAVDDHRTIIKNDNNSVMTAVGTAALTAFKLNVAAVNYKIIIKILTLPCGIFRFSDVADDNTGVYHDSNHEPVYKSFSEVYNRLNKITQKGTIYITLEEVNRRHYVTIENSGRIEVSPKTVKEINDYGFEINHNTYTGLLEIKLNGRVLYTHHHLGFYYLYQPRYVLPLISVSSGYPTIISNTDINDGLLINPSINLGYFNASSSGNIYNAFYPDTDETYYNMIRAGSGDFNIRGKHFYGYLYFTLCDCTNERLYEILEEHFNTEYRNQPYNKQLDEKTFRWFLDSYNPDWLRKIDNVPVVDSNEGVLKLGYALDSNRQLFGRYRPMGYAAFLFDEENDILMNRVIEKFISTDNDDIKFKNVVRIKVGNDRGGKTPGGTTKIQALGDTYYISGNSYDGYRYLYDEVKIYSNHKNSSDYFRMTTTLSGYYTCNSHEMLNNGFTSTLDIYDKKFTIIGPNNGIKYSFEYNTTNDVNNSLVMAGIKLPTVFNIYTTGISAYGTIRGNNSGGMSVESTKVLRALNSIPFNSRVRTIRTEVGFFDDPDLVVNVINAETNVDPNGKYNTDASDVIFSSNFGNTSPLYKDIFKLDYPFEHMATRMDIPQLLGLRHSFYDPKIQTNPKYLLSASYGYKYYDNDIHGFDYDLFRPGYLCLNRPKGNEILYHEARVDDARVLTSHELYDFETSTTRSLYNGSTTDDIFDKVPYIVTSRPLIKQSRTINRIFVDGTNAAIFNNKASGWNNIIDWLTTRYVPGRIDCISTYTAVHSETIYLTYIKHYANGPINIVVALRLFPDFGAKPNLGVTSFNNICYLDDINSNDIVIMINIDKTEVHTMPVHVWSKSTDALASDIQGVSFSNHGIQEILATEGITARREVVNKNGKRMYCLRVYLANRVIYQSTNEIYHPFIMSTTIYGFERYQE